MSFMRPPAAPPVPALPATPAQAEKPPMFGSQPEGAVQGRKPQAKSMTPTFLGAGTTPSPGMLGGKTLLGQ